MKMGNIQHPTSNIEQPVRRRGPFFGCWMLDVGCWLFFLLFACTCAAGNYTNFSVAVYIPINIVQSFDNPQKLQADWDCIRRQLKVDKVYIEVQRDRRLLADEQAERVKKFFLDQGVQVAGGLLLT